MRCLVFIVLLWPALAFTAGVNRGDTEAQVEQALGKPESVLDAGVKKILFYETTKITLKNGVVIKVEAIKPSGQKPDSPASDKTASVRSDAPSAKAKSRPVAPLNVGLPTLHSAYLGGGYTIELEAPNNFGPFKKTMGGRDFPIQYMSRGFDDKLMLTAASIDHGNNADLSAHDLVKLAMVSSQKAYEPFKLEFQQTRMIQGQPVAYYGYEGVLRGEHGDQGGMRRLLGLVVKVRGGFLTVSIEGPAPEMRSIQPALEAAILSLEIEDSGSGG